MAWTIVIWGIGASSGRAWIEAAQVIQRPRDRQTRVARAAHVRAVEARRRCGGSRAGGAPGAAPNIGLDERDN